MASTGRGNPEITLVPVTGGNESRQRRLLVTVEKLGDGWWK
jgi:hypothetical protein